MLSWQHSWFNTVQRIRLFQTILSWSIKYHYSLLVVSILEHYTRLFTLNGTSHARRRILPPTKCLPMLLAEPFSSRSSFVPSPLSFTFRLWYFRIFPCLRTRLPCDTRPIKNLMEHQLLHEPCPCIWILARAWTCYSIICNGSLNSTNIIEHKR
jgi:hypothetical protein